MATRDYKIRRARRLAFIQRDCPRCTNGWITYANEHTPLGRYRARWIRAESGLDYHESTATAAAVVSDGVLLAGETDLSTDPAEQVTVFRFTAHQACFQHPGPARFFAGPREHVKLADLIEDLDEHVGALHEQVMRG